MRVHICLQDVSAYGRLQMYSFNREILQPQFGVRSWEVSIGGGLTIMYIGLLINKKKLH